MNRIPIDMIERAHRGHWFSPGAKRFFNSRIAEDAYQTDDGAFAFFVSSEKCDWKSPRLYSVRRYEFATDTFETIGEFQGYASRSGAASAARRFALQGVAAKVPA